MQPVPFSFLSSPSPPLCLIRHAPLSLSSLITIYNHCEKKLWRKQTKTN